MVKAKTIWLREGTYNRLDALREKRETFSEAIERLIKLYATMTEVSDTLGPSHPVAERPPQKKEGLK